jgi:hypothetical protein
VKLQLKRTSYRLSSDINRPIKRHGNQDVQAAGTDDNVKNSNRDSTRMVSNETPVDPQALAAVVTTTTTTLFIYLHLHWALHWALHWDSGICIGIRIGTCVGIPGTVSARLAAIISDDGITAYLALSLSTDQPHSCSLPHCHPYAKVKGRPHARSH